MMAFLVLVLSMLQQETMVWSMYLNQQVQLTQLNLPNGSRLISTNLSSGGVWPTFTSASLS